MRTASAAVLAALVLGGAPAAAARPVTVEDLLQQQSLGAAAVDPAGRRIVFEQRDPWGRASRYDLDSYLPAALSRLMVAEVGGAGAARPLLPGEPAGQLIAAFSPSGARLAVFGFADGCWRAGVVEMATGRIRWLDLTPELPVFGRALQWRSDTELLVLDRGAAGPAGPLRQGRVSAERLPQLWARTADGRGALSVLGSGAWRHVRPRPAPRRLLTVDVRTGAARVLAEGAFTDLELSPDGAHVALLEAGEDLQPTAGRAVQGDWGVATQASHLVLLDLTTGRSRRPCARCDVLPHLLSWAPDSAALLVFARGPGDPWRAGRLLKVYARRDRAEPLGSTLAPLIEGRPEVVRAGWMGQDPVVLARPAGVPEGRLDWRRLPRGAPPVALTGALAQAPRELSALGDTHAVTLVDGQAWRLDREGRAQRLPIPGPLVDARGPRTDVEGRGWFAPRRLSVVHGPDGDFSLTPQGARRLLPARAAGGLPPWLGEGRSTLAVSPVSGATLVREIDARGVTTLQLRAPGHPDRAVARLDAGVADADPLAPRGVRHLGPDGQPLTSWLFLPARRAEGPPPPLLVRPYAGAAPSRPPTDPAGVTTLASDLRVLVGHGYAVLVPALPRPRHGSEPMAGLGPRILGIVDAAASDPELAGAFDPDRIVLWGHSYGGYTVMAAISQSHRFRAAVSIAGISDLAAKWGAIPPAHRVTPEDGVWTPWTAGSVEDGQGAMGAPPWADPMRYQRNSPLYAAGRITTPLLLIHGDQDGLPLAQSEAMFSALWRQDRDAVLVTYWGEGHYIISPGNLRDLYARAFAFLDRYLTTAPHAPSPARGPASSGPRPRRRRRRTARWRRAAR